MPNPKVKGHVQVEKGGTVRRPEKGEGKIRSKAERKKSHARQGSQDHPGASKAKGGTGNGL